MTKNEQIDIANKIIAAILPHGQMSLKVIANKIYLSYYRKGKEQFTLARLVKGFLMFQNQRLPIGATHEAAIALLVRWIREDTDYTNALLSADWACLGITSSTYIATLITPIPPEL